MYIIVSHDFTGSSTPTMTASPLKYKEVSQHITSSSSQD